MFGLNSLQLLGCCCVGFIYGDGVYIDHDFSTKFSNCSTAKPTINRSRTVELPTWGVNQSVWLEDYIDTLSSESFIWQPNASHITSQGSSAYCGPEVKALICVTSAPQNFEQRRAIRETWGSPGNLLSKGARLIFVLGTSGSDAVEAS